MKARLCLYCTCIFDGDAVWIAFSLAPSQGEPNEDGDDMMFPHILATMPGYSMLGWTPGLAEKRRGAVDGVVKENLKRPNESLVDSMSASLPL